MSTAGATLPAAADLAAAARDALDYAVRQSVDCARVTAGCTGEHRLVVTNNALSLAASTQERHVHILVHRQQKEGAASTNALSRTALCQSVDDALALARFAPADDCLVMPDAGQAPPAMPLPFLWDDAVGGLSLDCLREFIQAMQARLARDKRISIDRLEVSATRHWRGVFNTLGVEQGEFSSTIGWSVMGMAREGGVVGGFDYERRAVFRLDGALEEALRRCDAFCDRVVGNLRQARTPDYVGPVLLSPRAVQRLLMETVLYHCAGSSVANGTSRWAGKLGAAVVSPLLSVSDQPHDGVLAGARSFDRDGVPTRSRTLLASGILQSHLLDCQSARRIGARSTASAGGPFGLVCDPGKAGLADMQDARPELLMVDRFSGNLDPLTGDFSGVAKSSRLYRNGIDQGGVNGALISGNAFALLERVIAVSSAVDDVSGAMRLPWMLVDAVHVSGG